MGQPKMYHICVTHVQPYLSRDVDVKRNLELLWVFFLLLLFPISYLTCGNHLL